MISLSLIFVSICKDDVAFHLIYLGSPLDILFFFSLFFFIIG